MKNASDKMMNEFTDKERGRAARETVTVTSIEELDTQVGFYYYHIVFN
jgi:hypothetical protein